MELHWLRLIQGTVLELRPLKDYAGQDLIFNPASYKRRCVTKETLEEALVCRYIAMRMIEVEKPEQVPLAAPSVELPVTPRPVTPSPVKVPEPEEVTPDVTETEAPVLAFEPSVSDSSSEPSLSDEEPTKPAVESPKKKRR